MATPYLSMRDAGKKTNRFYLIVCLDGGHPCEKKIRKCNFLTWVEQHALNLWCDNFASVLNLRFFALQTIQYITRSKVIETETRELSSISRGKIKFGETDDWKNEKLFVPPLPPTNLRGCHLIRIQYDVFVSWFCLCFTYYTLGGRN